MRTVLGSITLAAAVVVIAGPARADGGGKITFTGSIVVGTCATAAAEAVGRTATSPADASSRSTGAPQAASNGCNLPSRSVRTSVEAIEAPAAESGRATSGGMIYTVEYN